MSARSWASFPTPHSPFHPPRSSQSPSPLVHSQQLCLSSCPAGRCISTIFLDSRIVKSLSCARLFVTPWTVAHQAPSSVGFSRQAYWSGLPFPSPGDLPDPGIEPGSSALQADALTSEPADCVSWVPWLTLDLQKIGLMNVLEKWNSFVCRGLPVISILLNLFRLVLWPILLSILKNIPYALEKYLLNPTSLLCHIRTLVSHWFYFIYLFLF